MNKDYQHKVLASVIVFLVITLTGILIIINPYIIQGLVAFYMGWNYKKIVSLMHHLI